MIDFEDLGGQEASSSSALTVEEWFDEYPKALEILPVYLSVRRIQVTEYGYKFHTDYFTVFCSHKFRKLASKIQNYLAEVDRMQPIPTLIVAITGMNGKGYIDWTFGNMPKSHEEKTRLHIVYKTQIGKITDCEFYAAEGFDPESPYSGSRTQSPHDPFQDFLLEVDQVMDAVANLKAEFKEPPARKRTPRKG